jgi:hypothetical protein
MEDKENDEKDQSCGDGSEEGPFSPCESKRELMHSGAKILHAKAGRLWLRFLRGGL